MTNNSNEALLHIKKQLVDALGENKSLYFQQMKDWFRGKMTKEEFDSNARDLLTTSTVHLHNEFFLAILTKCQLFTTSAPPPSSMQSSSDISLENLRSNSSNGVNTPTSSVLSTGSSDLFSDRLNANMNANIIYGSSSSSSSSDTFFGSSNSYSSSNILTSQGANKISTNNDHFSNSSSTANSNALFNSLLNSTNSNNFSTNTLGTKTNAITINNTSGNISIKVEVPLHSLDGNIINTSSLGLSTPNTPDKKKQIKNPKKKAKLSKQNPETIFEPVNLHSIAPTVPPRDANVLRDARAGHHTRAHCLLGMAELKGRLLLAAWDHGLNAATEGVVRLLHHATKQVLQNVIISILKSRGGFKVREGRFVHSLGTSPPNPWLRSATTAVDWTADSVGGCSDTNSVGDRPLLWPTTEAAQQNGAHLLSFAHPKPPPHGPINCFDLYTALKTWPSVLPCHTVYSLCMERTSARLSHMDHAALAQESVVKQEQRLRQQLRQYRIMPSL